MYVHAPQPSCPPQLAAVGRTNAGDARLTCNGRGALAGQWARGRPRGRRAAQDGVDEARAALLRPGALLERGDGRVRNDKRGHALWSSARVSRWLYAALGVPLLLLLLLLLLL